MKTKASKRLLTQSEREMIRDKCVGKQKAASMLTFILYGLVLLIGGGIAIATSSLQLAFPITLVLFLFAFACMHYSKKQTKFLLESEEIYGTEGIFMESNKYGQATFEVKVSGKKELLFERATLCDKINRGDTVILIKNNGITLVYLMEKTKTDREGKEKYFT